jgi:hypothetical protein
MLSVLATRPARTLPVTLAKKAPDDTGAGAEAVDEAAQKEQARAERAAAAAERERCAAFNDELGVAVVDSLSRVKVDERTVKILTAVIVAGELDRIGCAARATASRAG